MSIGPIVPCLWLDDQAEEAAHLYTRIFPDGRVLATALYPVSFDNPGNKPRGSVLTVDFEIAGQRFTALNGGPQFTINPNISFFAFTDSVEDTNRLFAELSEGGVVMMPLDTYPWSERFAWIQDRFGVSWQVTTRREPGGPTIVPSLMFHGDQRRRAEQAMRFYVEVFPGGRIDSIDRYGAEESARGLEGTVKQGRFHVAATPLSVMDSQVDHAFEFNEAVSLQVMCDDQAEIDRMWSALTNEGEEGPCGWLKDRFGVSWQIAPRDAAELMASDDVAARERAFKAMLPMKKLDVKVLRDAFAGRAA